MKVHQRDHVMYTHWQQYNRGLCCDSLRVCLGGLLDEVYYETSSYFLWNVPRPQRSLSPVGCPAHFVKQSWSLGPYFNTIKWLGQVLLIYGVSCASSQERKQGSWTLLPQQFLWFCVPKYEACGNILLTQQSVFAPCGLWYRGRHHRVAGERQWRRVAPFNIVSAVCRALCGALMWRSLSVLTQFAAFLWALR